MSSATSLGTNHVHRHSLSICSPTITQKEVIAQIENMDVIDSLTICASNVSGECLFRLKHPERLRFLSMSGCRFRNRHMRYVEPMTSLETLALEGLSIKDKGMAHIRHLRELTTLNINDTSVGDKGFKSLKGLTKLTYLYASETSITDTALAVLEDLRVLKIIDISGTWVRGPGFRHLTRLPFLESIVARETWLSDRGMPYLEELIERQNNPRRFADLDVTGSYVTRTGTRRLMTELGVYVQPFSNAVIHPYTHWQEVQNLALALRYEGQQEAIRLAQLLFQRLRKLRQ